MELAVAVIEDDPRFRSTLATFLKHAPGLRPAGVYGSAESALAALDAAAGDDCPWDLVLMDLELPGISGIEATRKIKRAFPDTVVVVLTVFEEAAVILEAISAGADGYLLKKSSSRELLDQLRTITDGGAPLTARVARTLLDLVRHLGVESDTASGPSPARLDLTEREQDVLRCLVRGMSYARAGEHLGIGVGTVRTHIKAIYRKLQVHTVAEAVSRAVRERLV